MIAICCNNRKFTNIKSILLDKDGTLENSQKFLLDLATTRASLIESQIKQNLKQSLLKAWGIREQKLDPTGLMAVGSKAENAIASAAYLTEQGYSWFGAKEIVNNAFEQADRRCAKTPQSCSLFPGVREQLQTWVKAGLKLGIVSADSTAAVEAFTRNYELSEYIDLSLGSDRAFSKPDPKLFIQACQILRVSPCQTIMVGDSLGDIEMARKGGAAGTIGISWVSSLVGHLKTADVEIENLQEIKIFY